MTFETSDWAVMLNRTITIVPFLSEDSAGKRTYDVANQRTAKARIKDDVKTWRWKDGTERQSRSMVYFSDAAVGPKDKIILPAGYDPQVPAIVWFVRCDDEGGYHHSEVYV